MLVTHPLCKVVGMGCFAATILLYPTPIGLNARGDDPNASHWPFMLGEGILMLVNGGQWICTILNCKISGISTFLPEIRATFVNSKFRTSTKFLSTF